MREQRAERYQQRILLRVAGEVVGDSQSPGHVFLGQRARQFEIVEILADADVLLDVLGRDARGPFGQESHQLVDFVGDLRNVGPQVIHEHRHRLGVDRAVPAPDVFREPPGDFVVARAHRLEDDAPSGDLLVELGALVHVALFVTQYQNRRRAGRGRVKG